MVKTILVQDDKEYEVVSEARELLIHKGLDALPKDVAEKVKEKIKLQNLTRGTVVVIACLVLAEMLKKQGGGKNDKD